MHSYGMNTQNQIKRTLSESTRIEYVCDLLERKEILHRSELAARVCERFGFHDPGGQPQHSGCLKALRELAAAGHFTLPAPRTRPGQRSPRRLSAPVPLPVALPSAAGEVRDLELVLVTTPAQMRIWNELMIEGHPLGAGPLVGRQLRYLIGSRHGWLGGFGFAAAALNLADRDAWIGWNVEQRRKHLHRLVGMSRFLLRPSVQCHNLASKVLSMSLARLADDFAQRYGYRPWLVESFVDTAHYAGTSYQAANWTQLGQTRGRGRQDRFNQSALSKKTIYVYPVVDDFRRRMGLSVNAGLGALGATDGLETPHWAEHEFGGAALGDIRLSNRLVNVAAAKAAVPGRAFSGVAKGDWPSVKAYYRLIDHPDEAAINMSNILAPHRRRTVRRMQGQKTVLCVQDGCDLDYTNLDQCAGLGEGVANQTGATRRGLHLHSTFALAPNGLPLGVLRAQCTAPRSRSSDDHRGARSIPIEEKKTFVWVAHHRDLVGLASKMPQTQLIHVCDREADFFELFDEQRQNPRVELLVRAKHDRNLTEAPGKLFAAVRQQPVLGRLRVPIPRESARAKKNKQKARAKRPARMAHMALRSQRIQLRPAHYHADKEPIDIWVVHAREKNPPTNAKAIEWFLLTTIDVSVATAAEQCLRWYCLRWRIEDWHRVMKSGCRIEDLEHQTAERLRRAIAINMVIAWRIMLMTLLGRESPELPAEVLFSDVELRTLQAYAKKKETPPPELLGEAVRMVAKIGGYLGRANDPPPGHQLLWQGYREFQFMCLGFALLEDA
ncbi:MAG: IS4 family transposase [Pseudomonadota bacterium]|nr:IS4 family transposase [Pseudomonadota bacterium]